MCKRYLLILLFLFCFLSAVNADDYHWEIYSGAISQYYETMAVSEETVCIFSDIGIHYFDIGTSVFHNYLNRNYGLPEEEITHACFDSQGTLWFVTSQGLYSFDTSNIVSHDGTPDIDLSTIKDLVIDSHDAKWLLCSDNLWKYSDASWEQYSIPAGKALCLAVDMHNHLWIGTRENGLLEFDGVDWHQHLSEDAVYYGGIRSVTIDDTNKKWMTTYKKVLLTFHNDAWETIEFYEGSGPYDYIASTQGSILFKTSRNKMTRLRGDSVLFSDIFEFNAEFLSIATNENSMWALTNEGLFTLNDEREDYSCYGHPWLLGRYIRKVVSDPDNDCIWISHNNSTETTLTTPLGLTQFNGKTWETPITYDVLYSENYRSNDFGTSLHVHNGVAWTNYGTTLVSYDGRSLSFYGGFSDHLDRGGLIWNIVHDIRPAFNGYYWICQHLSEPAMQTAAITWFRPSPKPEVRDFVANRSSSKTCFAWDNKARLWAGSSGGLLYIGRPRYNANDDYHGFENINKYITCMAVDTNNKLWMGVAESYNIDKAEGLLCYSLGENSTSIFFECKYDISNSELPSNFINAIVFDKNDNMWIGTDRGAVRFDGETWTTFNIDNSPLQNNNVNAITVENDNIIWFGTNNGIAKYTGEVITTSVDEEDETPEAIPIIRSYPNPFNPSTTIEFMLPESGFTTLSIYNISGQKVRELAAGYMIAGVHSLIWDGRDSRGVAVSSGVYITRLAAGKQVAAGRMILLK